MNELVTKVLESRLNYLERDINHERSQLSQLAISTSAAGIRLDRLTAERRAIKDHLEASA